MIRSNSIIDNFILGMGGAGELHIWEEYAWRNLASYLNELELLRAGAPYKELGISQRRAESNPFLLTAAANVTTDIYDMKYERETPKGSIAVLSLKGVMMLNGDACSYGISDTMRWLGYAVENRNIDGIIFDVDSGGGEARAGQRLKIAVEEANEIKPVIAWADMMASAAVMAMLPAREIVAKNKMAQFGSIGTYMSIDMEFVNWYKENVKDVYADKSTNKNKEWRQVLEGDFTGIQAMVNKTNKNFLEDVQTYRPLSGDIEDTLSGSIFDTAEAKKRGLVDGMGNLAYAVKRVQFHAQNS